MTRTAQFPAPPPGAFHGLPGLLADSLPDRFGNTLIDAWLATQGRRPESFSSVERLCYIGTRGMGAPELVPAAGPALRASAKISVDAMAKDVGITMSECRLLEEGGRRHFMARRFDRQADGGKLHMQSLAAFGRLQLSRCLLL